MTGRYRNNMYSEDYSYSYFNWRKSLHHNQCLKKSNSTPFCRLMLQDILDANDIPCHKEGGLRACMDCKNAYVQLLNISRNLKEAESLLCEMGVNPIPKEPKKPTRFENII